MVAESMPRRDLLIRAGHSLARWGIQAVENVVFNRSRVMCRPPGAGDEVSFVGLCDRCGRCAEVCPAQAIQLRNDQQLWDHGTPVLDPHRQPCAFCGRCIQTCATGALSLDRGQQPIGQVVIDASRCLAQTGGGCGCCVTSCPRPGALKLGSTQRLELEERLCNGCGSCARACIMDPPALVVVPHGRRIETTMRRDRNA